MQDKIFEQQIAHLYSQYPVQNVAMLIFTFFELWVLLKPGNIQTILVWGALLCSVILMRIGCTRLYQTRASRFTPVQWGRLSILLTSISTLFFCYIPLALVDYSSQFDFFVVSLSLLTVVIGVMNSSAAYLPVYIVFSFSVIGTFALSLFLYMEEGSSVYIFMLTVFLAFASMMAIRNTRLIKDSIRLRFEHIDLIEQLSEEKNTSIKANLSKSKFLAAASHDLRQPVHAMSMLIELLDKMSLPAQANLMVEKLGKSVTGLRSLFDSLLDVSSLDAGIVEVNPVSCSVRHSLDQITELYKPQACEKGLTLQAQGEDIWLQTDPVLLQRILGNLVSNAIIHTDSGEISLRVLSTAQDVSIEVRDTGKGIAPADQEKIFDEFQQLHNPERDRRKGLGLGLAICKRLADLLNCQLLLNSQIEEGSCFTLVFKREVAAANLVQPKIDTSKITAIESDLIGCEILLIDDETDILEVFSALLTSWGAKKVVAVSDEEAACDSIIEGFKPDIIVSDYRLRHEKTGLQAIDMVSEMLGYTIPAIVISGDTSPQSLAEFERSGHTVLFKPVPTEKLKSELLRQLSDS